MAIEYKIVKNDKDVEYIEMTSEDGILSFVPIDEGNSDYQAYLASLDEQQAALEAK